MSVFLRWGVFGILGVAALLYAYNANKRLAEHRDSHAVAGEASQGDSAAEDGADDQAEQDEEPMGEDEAASDEVAADSAEWRAPSAEILAACAEEQRVAERALKMRRDGGGLDELLRIDLIALQEQAQRRERLAAVARRWFERAGRDPDADTLRDEVLRDCRNAEASPAP